MVIYKKVTLYAAVEIPDNLDDEQVEEKRSELETQISMDLDNMQEDGSSDYTYRYCVDDVQDFSNPSYELQHIMNDMCERVFCEDELKDALKYAKSLHEKTGRKVYVEGDGCFFVGFHAENPDEVCAVWEATK